MDIIVPIRFVPDLVDELEIDPNSGQLDCTFMRWVPGEMDEHAVEQAILLKDRLGGTVTVIAPDMGDVDEALYTASAKGADRLVKITGGSFDEGTPAPLLVTALKAALAEMSYDLVLTATAAIDDLQGAHGALLAAELDLPYVGYVTGVETANGGLAVRKEYPGGLLSEVETQLPAVIGIQAAEEPPRYVVTNLVMQAMKEAQIDEIEAAALEDGRWDGVRMSLPERGERAQLLEGSPTEVADALVALLRERGVLA